MATMKFALVSLTLFVLLEAYNARHLHDVSMKRSFEGRPLFHMAVIQLVTGEQEHDLLPQSSLFSSSYDHTTYGRVNSSPPPPKVAPSKGQETYGYVNSSPPPPPPKVAPTKGQATYVQVNPSPPPPPKGAPSKGQETLGRVNSSPPPPKGAPSKGQETLGRVKSSPPPPIEAPPRKPSSTQDGSMEQAKFGRDDPTKPTSPDPNDSQGHDMYGRGNPSPPAAPTKPADPTHPLLSACTGLSTSNEDRWDRLLSYVTRVFKYDVEYI